MPLTQPVRTEVGAEDVRLGELLARVEALQHELVVLVLLAEGGGDEKAVVQDAQDEGEEAVRDGREGEEGAGGERGEDLDEDLHQVYYAHSRLVVIPGISDLAMIP